MTLPKQYVSRASTLQESLAAVAKLPWILAEAITRWGEIEVIVRKREKHRSQEQNKLQRKWCKEAAAQGDMTAEEYRGYCKLHFGVPILRRDSEAFREVYDRLIRPRDYAEKLELMMEPLDFQVTRLMTTAQKGEYLDAMWTHFTGLGFRLTDPNLKGMDPSQYKEAA
ncbi:hypothetical protein EKK97_13925 [Billgrantia tianxiuensis]|uniref:Uncharacterized protein n=1 Tax=Billgrantia tianxiuensis TaxID=2497861 RepID=A0A6I6SU15_9GAMM|nr:MULTISPECIES: hypothetical protein [Halomonas]MCE8034596.1 hypothetical protein [Halomonas sp. MCCC 1A11057]QHC50463.1 hypothetical protein EKK97_13925 [Halomonas tianxiuensis]